MRPVHLVVPDGVDDPELPSGGNVYDRRVIDGLGGRAIAVPGAWPRPGEPGRAALRRALTALPDGAAVLVDGLVAGGVPDVVVPQARRLALAVLVHLPLSDDLAAAERETLRAARAVVATSGWTARQLRERYGVTAAVARPGVDPAPLAPGTDGAGRLLCVGSISAIKGQDVLVDALARVHDLPWTCALVGPLRRDPAHVALVRRSVAAHGLTGRIALTGPRTGPDLDAAYAAADLLVLPSRVEAYGMVVTEALARGVPVLATDAGGVTEALGDGPRLLVPPGDPAALAAALRRWLTEPDLRDDLRAAARTRRDALTDWEVTTRCLSQVLDRLPA